MTNLQVARTIQQQLGNKAIFMMAAKDFVGDDNSLTFRIGRNAGGYKKITITLTPMDDYRVEFFKIRNKQYVPTVTGYASHEGIYADMLHAIIQSETGLSLSLSRNYASYGDYKPDSTTIPEIYI